MTEDKRAVWLILTYKVPTEPSKIRVAIWRRIRSLGAVYLHNTICILPLTPEHQRQMRMVQADVESAGGDAVLFETLALDAKQEARVVAHFKNDRDQDYEEFFDKCEDYERELEKEVQADHYTFAELKENDEDLKKLKNWLDRIKAIDFYGAPARAEAEKRVIACEALLDAYANAVYEREQSGAVPASKPAKKVRVRNVSAKKAIP